MTRICFFGESFVNGTGDPECLGWTGRICAAACQQGYDITYYNLGVRRQTSTELKKRWLDEVSCRLSPEFDSRIVFSFGVNNTTIENGKTRVDFSTSVENLSYILGVAKQMFPVLMVGPPLTPDCEQNQRIARLSAKYAEACQKLDIAYLDTFTKLQSSTIWLQEAAANDGYHPRAGGYTEFANIVQNWSSWLSWF
ncbi:lipolytic protein G-D-S-L family [Gloeocapsa sp. PCC 7428]|uniref:GDSL-type esterase/lipase family protein n=1 Tax=Gloeocapsa sp. PCC 7428 TaxID=1173026 RepID=UPI0002A5BC1E|nr:GDSL-type esterase/lipase family protein [Gloeocapsa sp. PCC 7428]AFZ32494.1 lipolytic protein G-D-S-L family [Gloeocapsa sp. PCC 7428]